MAFATPNRPQLFPYETACGEPCRKEFSQSNLTSHNGDVDEKHFVVADTLADFMREYDASSTKNLVLVDTPLSKEDVEKVAMLLGGLLKHGAFEPVRTIAFDPKASVSSIALSAGAHPIHLDGTFAETTPESFLLHFAISDPEGGGRSLFYSVQDILAECPLELVDAALTSTVRYARKRHDGDATDEMVGQMLEKDGRGGVIFRWRYDDQVKPEIVDAKGKPIAEFIEWVRQYMENTPPISYQAKSGDTILIRQRYYLHGRSALSSVQSPRKAYRAWTY